MAKQTFTTGQVLTAAQMTSLQQTAMGGGDTTAKTASYVLVAADAGTTVAMNAAGSTTITVNTGLFAAGDTVFIQNRGAGVCTITAGTATVNTHGSLALSQYEGGQLYFTATGAAIFFDVSQSTGGGGKVLQVVSATTSTSTSITTSTYTDTTITATITPTLNTSKILVMIAANSQIYTTTARTWIAGKGRIMRGATEILANDPDSYIEGASSSSLAWKGQQSYIYLDSPATTSATTYKLQGAIGTGFAILFQSGATSTITLLEIGA
jgi:hypothetical protein